MGRGKREREREGEGEGEREGKRERVHLFRCTSEEDAGIVPGHQVSQGEDVVVTLLHSCTGTLTLGHLLQREGQEQKQ